MLKISQITVLSTKREIKIYFEDSERNGKKASPQQATIWPFALTLISKVTDRLPKSSLAAIKKTIEKSEYITNPKPSLHQWKALENELKQYIGKTVESYGK